MIGRLRRWFRGGAELTLRGVAKVLFIVALLVLTALAVSASAPLVLAALAMFIVYIMLKTVLPAARIETLAADLWSGDLFVRWWQRLTGWAR